MTAIPKRISYASKEIWELQSRLEQRSRHNVQGTLNHPRFRAAYDFLLLREDSGEELENSGEWWTQFQFGDKAKQEEMMEALPSDKRRRRRRKKTRSTGNSA